MPARSKISPISNVVLISFLAFLPLLILIAYFVAAILFPYQGKIRAVDAIIVLGGGGGERLERGLELTREGFTDVLVLNKGVLWNATAGEVVSNTCRRGFSSLRAKLICVVAYPDSTKGEAITFSALARTHKWNHIAIVTSVYHSTRAKIWFDRCFEGQVDMVTASFQTTAFLFFREAAALIQANLLDRTCVITD